MFTWAAFLVIVSVAGGCLAAMGVGTRALLELSLAVGLMSCIAGLIAWPFLRQSNDESRSAAAKTDPKLE